MKHSNILKSAISLFMMLCVALSIIACNSPVQNGEIEYAVFAAQVGYKWEIPTPNNISNYDVTIKNSDNVELEVENNTVFFDKVGEYTVSYTSGNVVNTAKVNVVDTERPRFSKFWQGEWQDNVAYGETMMIRKGVGETVDMDDYFKCVDNSGYADVKFKVLRGGADEVTLSEENTFEVENVDFYWLYATAKDNSNNFTAIKYKLAVRVLTATDSYTNKTGAIQWGAIKLDTSDFNLGDIVKVTLKVKTDITTQYSVLSYVNETGAMGMNPKGGFGIFNTYTDWTEISFTAKVVTGSTARSVVQNGWSDGKNYMPYSPINDTEQGVFLVIVNQGNGQSVWVKDVTITKA